MLGEESVFIKFFENYAFSVRLTSTPPDFAYAISIFSNGRIVGV